MTFVTCEPSPIDAMIPMLVSLCRTDSALETTWKIANTIYDRHFPEPAIRLPELQARVAEQIRTAA